VVARDDDREHDGDGIDRPSDPQDRLLRYPRRMARKRADFRCA
jgi:hypothetical protein